jgi:ketosteroid isomerase-like protein
MIRLSRSSAVKALFLTGLIQAGAPSARAQSLTPVERTAVADSVRRLTDGFIAALGSLDPARFSRQFTSDPDFSYVDNGARYPDREALARAAGGFFARTRSLTGRWESPEITVLGRDAASFVGTFRATGTDKDGKPVWTAGKVWTLLYQRRGGEWQIVHAHESDAR